MAQSLAGFTSILKEFYLGPIQDQLNEETLVCDMFEKGSVDWNGRQVFIPVHTGRNTSVAFAAEGAAIGNSAVPVLLNVQPQQVYNNLIVNAAFLYGRFVITGPAMAAAGKGGANSFVGWVDSEMNRLVNDIKNQSNRTAVSGGTVIGFVATDTDAAAGVPTAVNYTGDVAKAVALAAAGGADHVTVVRTDTYATISTGLVVITATTPGTVTLDAVGGINFATAPTVDPAGNAVPCALVLTGAGAAAIGAGAEVQGIYANVGDPTHFGLDRTTATGVPALQCGNGAGLSNLLCLGTQAAVGNVRDAITLAGIQTVLDRITLASDDAPDTILMNPLQRTRLVAILQATAQMAFNTDQGASGEAKMGFSGFSYAGLPLKTSRHVDNGAMWFLHTKSWKMLVLESGKFADEDGSTLSRVAGADAFEGFYKWYYNITCVRPNAQGAILGLLL